MLKLKLFFIWSLLATFSCVPGSPQERLPDAPEPVLLSEAYPALSGISQIKLVVETRGNFSSAKFKIDELKDKVTSTLEENGIEVFKPEKDEEKRSFYIPILKIQLEGFALSEPAKVICRIQSSLERQVCLTGNSRLKFQADVWESEPVMQLFSDDNFPRHSSKIVLKQVDFFIHSYAASQSLGKFSAPSQSDSPSASSVEQEKKPDEKPVRREYKYVASKNSSVFHKPSCSSAKRIKEKNKIFYSNREEAINDGRRPCKICKP